MKNTWLSLIYLVFAILNFILFAYYIEYDRDFWTWMHLLSSIIFFVLSILIVLMEVIREIRLLKK